MTYAWSFALFMQKQSDIGPSWPDVGALRIDIVYRAIDIVQPIEYNKC